MLHCQKAGHSRALRLLASLLAAACVFRGGAFAATRLPARKSVHATEAAARYQAGVDFYADGRYSEALIAFQDALRLDPSDRAARAAVNRLHAEWPRSAARRPAAPANALLRKPREQDESIIAAVERFVVFERTVGDARNQQGELMAKQGRIAQLLIERKVSRELRRTFLKEAELHGLSRRLPPQLS